MIEHIDRVPTKPNRYAVYDENHNFLRYEHHERADEPVQIGNPFNKALQDEFLAASGTTAGTASALTLAQPGFVLADGATVRIKLHVDSGATPTLNINGTGAKAILDQNFANKLTGFKQNSVGTLVYSAAKNAYITQGFTDALLTLPTQKSSVELLNRTTTAKGSVHTIKAGARYVIAQTGANSYSNSWYSTDELETQVALGQTPYIGESLAYTAIEYAHGRVYLLASNGRYVTLEDGATSWVYSPDTALNSISGGGWVKLKVADGVVFAFGQIQKKIAFRRASDTAFQVYTFSEALLMNTVCYFNGKYRVYGETAVCFESSDLVTWTKVTITHPSGIQRVRDILPVSGKLIAYATMSDWPYLYQSPDGLAWTTLYSLPYAFSANGLLYMSGEFMCLTAVYFLSPAPSEAQKGYLFDATGSPLIATFSLSYSVARIIRTSGAIYVWSGSDSVGYLSANLNNATPVSTEGYVQTVGGSFSALVRGATVNLGFKPRVLLYKESVSTVCHVITSTLTYGALTVTLTDYGFTSTGGSGFFIAWR